MEELEEMEEDAGLGNGGLGRLAGKNAGRCLRKIKRKRKAFSVDPFLFKDTIARGAGKKQRP